MSKPMDEDRRIAEQLSAHRLAAPSPELRAQVLKEARLHWSETDAAAAFVPWTTVALRLAACVAIAIALVWAANLANRRSVTRWQTAEHGARRAADITGLESVLQGHTGRWKLAVVAARLPDTGASQELLRYTQRIGEILEREG